MVVLAVITVLAAPVVAQDGRSVSVVSEARAINMKASDLPSRVHWTAAPAAASSKAVVALAEKTVACLKRVGKVSPDPFGTRGLSGGEVEADISSPTYYQSSSFTQLPSASSEVVFLTSAAAARADQAIVAKPAALACLTTQFVGDSSLGGAGKVKGTGSFLSVHHYGQGDGGVHVQFLVTGGLLPSKLYDNEYFYVQGNAEISMSFINLGSAFDAGWSSVAIAKVMARAAATVKD